MRDQTKSVFISYASQDAAAAGRIGEALRAADIEVWLDQSELRGGDAWDHKIRQQIKECGTSAFHFKSKDTPIPEIARQLGVAYVVEGSVRRAGDRSISGLVGHLHPRARAG